MCVLRIHSCVCVISIVRDVCDVHVQVLSAVEGPEAEALVPGAMKDAASHAEQALTIMCVYCPPILFVGDECELFLCLL